MTPRIDPDAVLWSAPAAERAGRPLLILLHGHGSNERGGFEFRHQLPADLVLASLRAPRRAGAGYAWFPLDPSLALSQIDEVSHAVLDWLTDQPAAPSVGILGFSQGSSIGLQCLRIAPERFGYAVVLSGFAIPGAFPGDGVLARQRPDVFWGRGDRDVIIPPFLIPLTRTWLRAHTNLTERVYPGLGHYVVPEELADLSRFLDGQLAGDPRSG